MTEEIEPHEADGQVVVTVIGSDGLRWACRTCDQTVYAVGDRFLHFRRELNLPPAAPEFDDNEETVPMTTDTPPRTRPRRNNMPAEIPDGPIEPTEPPPDTEGAP